MDEREVVGLAGFKEAPFQGLVDKLGVLESPARGNQIDGVVVPDEAHCLVDRAELVHERVLLELQDDLLEGRPRARFWQCDPTVPK